MLYYDEYRDILDCLEQPAFLVQNGKILFGNAQCAAAETSLCTLLQEGVPPDVQTIADAQWDFMLHPIQDFMLVLAMPHTLPLDVMQTTARSLRTALAGMYSMLHVLLPALAEQEHPRTRQRITTLNHYLHQVFRLVGNMEIISSENLTPNLEALDLCDFLKQLHTTVTPLCALIERQLKIQLPNAPIYAVADPQMLERSILNLISNAIRFSKDTGAIILRLYHTDRHAVIEVQNTAASGVTLADMARVSAAPLSAASDELNLDVVRKTAQIHNGALMFRPLNDGIAAMFSLPLRHSHAPLRSARVSYDYAGGFNHVLLELSDVLPTAVYQSMDFD